MLLHRIPARVRSLGATDVRRVLPSPVHRKVGPWVFLDHFGPEDVPEDGGLDVRPHPHCALSTVTWLFEGAVEHRDSTGGHAVVRPGEIHWMRAGHGIVHSERRPSDPARRARRAHGLQLWCAHPDGAEEQEPRFDSYTQLPEVEVEGVRVRLLAGDGWGAASPVDGNGADPHTMLVVDRAARVITAQTDAWVAILGGDAIGPRQMWWNFVHSDPGRLAEQAERWRRREFPSVPGDEVDFTPAPSGGPRP